MRRIKLLIEYNGSGFHGWQVQNDMRTIQGVMVDTLQRMFHHDIKLVGASRTDAGVHALAQVAHFDTVRDIPAENIRKGLNSLLPNDISVLAAEETDQNFHARFSARGKVYQYKIFTRSSPSPFQAKFAWHIPMPLNLENMRTAGNMLLGEHDFSAFRASSCSAVSPVRKIKDIEIHQKHELIHITVSGSGFLHHMVRTIVGTLVAIGRGTMNPEHMEIILKSRDRSMAAKTAPPQGLYLIQVTY